MRSKGSRFTLGVWGLRVCSLDVAQPSATVRNRPRDPHMAVPMVSSAKGVTFGGLTYSVASFRVAGVALRDIQTCFVACRKSFNFRRSASDVSCCVFFCESHCQGCVKWRQGGNSVAGVAFCKMC